MRKYKLTFLLVIAPFMATSGAERLRETGWSPILGVLEIALAVAISVGAGKEIRDGRRRRSSGE